MSDTPTSYHEKLAFRLMDSLSVPIFVLDGDSNFVFANQSFHAAAGVEPGTFTGQHLWELFDPEKYDHLRMAYSNVYRLRERSVIEVEFREYGTVEEFHISYWEGYVVVEMIDITRFIQNSTELRESLAEATRRLSEVLTVANEATEIANTDSLTGLMNRRRSEEIAGSVFRGMRMGGLTFSVLLLDVDHFKRFNDEYGHAEGDLVLRTVGTALQTIAFETETAARFGGEEFVVICPTLGLWEASRRAQAFLDAVRTLSGTVAPITASIGVASLSVDDESWSDVVERADRAMYLAKNRGRNRVEVWAADHDLCDQLRQAA